MIVPVWCTECRRLVDRVIGILPDTPGSWAVRYPGGPDEPVLPVRCKDHLRHPFFKHRNRGRGHRRNANCKWCGQPREAANHSGSLP